MEAVMLKDDKPVFVDFANRMQRVVALFGVFAHRC